MATYYISPSGNDTTGDGSSGSPWATLAKFVSSSSDGDTCSCAPGTYTWSSATLTGRSVVADSPDSPAVFDAGGGDATWRMDTSVSTPQVELRNLRFTNLVKPGSQPPAFYNSKYGTVLMTNCQFDNLSFVFNGLIGHPTFAPAGDPTFVLENCLINDMLSSYVNDSMFNFSSAGASTSITAYIEITNCVFFFETSNASSLINYIFKIPVNDSSGSAVDVTIKNTIFYNASGLTVSYKTGGSTRLTSTLSNNCLYLMNGIPSGTNNITDDPLFVDAANGNFNLRPTSPCINTGVLI